MIVWMMQVFDVNVTQFMESTPQNTSRWVILAPQIVYDRIYGYGEL